MRTLLIQETVEETVELAIQPVAILGSAFHEALMARRLFLRQMMALPLLGLTAWGEESPHKALKVMMKSAWGSDDPTPSA